MKILLTGAAGFIGSHLVDAFLADGHEVVAIDNFSSGKRENLNPQATFVELDITHKTAVKSVFADHGPFDLISHHAAQKSVTQSVREPVSDAEINILGSLNLLEAATAAKVPRVIFASTGGVMFDEHTNWPANEDTIPTPPPPYGIAKLSVEQYLRFYRLKGLTTQILRYSNVYGPRQDPAGEAGVVAIMSQRIINGQPVVIYGDGEQTRDFMFIDDLVEANRRAIATPRSGLWHIGTGKETSVNTIARYLQQHAAQAGLTPAPIDYQPARNGEGRRSVLDCQRAASELHWAATTTIDNGLARTFDWFLAHSREQ